MKITYEQTRAAMQIGLGHKLNDKSMKNHIYNTFYTVQCL